MDPDFNEIVFENRNKEYGAYFLRKKYKLYVIVSLVIAIASFSVIIILPFITSQTKVYADGTPGGIKYVQLTTDHLDFPKENPSSEPVTGMMQLEPVITESGSSKNVLKESEYNRIYYYEESADSPGVLESRPSFQVYSSPAWSPGILAGRAVRVQCSVTLALTIK